MLSPVVFSVTGIAKWKARCDSEERGGPEPTVMAKPWRLAMLTTRGRCAWLRCRRASASGLTLPRGPGGRSAAEADAL